MIKKYAKSLVFGLLLLQSTPGLIAKARESRLNLEEKEAAEKEFVRALSVAVAAQEGQELDEAALEELQEEITKQLEQEAEEVE